MGYAWRRPTGVITALPEWVLDLFPVNWLDNRLYEKNILRGAVIRGMFRLSEAKLAQVSIYKTVKNIGVELSGYECFILKQNMRKAHISKLSTGLRTAIMLGLPLGRDVYDGVMSPTRIKRFTRREIATLLNSRLVVSTHTL